MAGSHITQSVSEIDNNNWLIGSRLLLSRQNHRSPSTAIATWESGKDSFFVLSEPAETMPESRLPPKKSDLALIHDAGDTHAVWRIGESIIKVNEVNVRQATTREHVTLAYLQDKLKNTKFIIPRVYHHWESDGRYWIVMERLAGQTLNRKWASMHDEAKEYYVNRITSICEDLAAFEGNSISGIDGHQLSDRYLSKNCSDDGGFLPHTLLANCRDMGMDCSLPFVFYHCDLGPGNIIILDNGNIGIIDWETAGFVPRQWIRTKFRISSGMNLDIADQEAAAEWRARVSRCLGEMGYTDVVDSWKAWSVEHGD